MARPGTQQYADGVRPMRSVFEPGAGPAVSDRMTIEEFAAATGATLRALRFYQSKGLLARPRDAKARVFSLADRNRLDLILQGKRLGFSLREIREILAAHDCDNTPALPVNRRRSAAQIEFLERQRQDLTQAICQLRQIYSCLFQDLLTIDQSPARNGS